MQSHQCPRYCALSRGRCPTFQCCSARCFVALQRSGSRQSAADEAHQFPQLPGDRLASWVTRCPPGGFLQEVCFHIRRLSRALRALAVPSGPGRAPRSCLPVPLASAVLSAPGWWRGDGLHAGEGFGPQRVSFSPGELYLVLAGSHKCSLHLVPLL